MSARKPTRIADTPNLPTLPTIRNYFAMMAEGQGEEIRRLKRESIGKSTGKPVKKRSDTTVPDPWLLHPIRHVEARDRQTAGGKDTRSAAKRVPKKISEKEIPRTVIPGKGRPSQVTCNGSARVAL